MPWAWKRWENGLVLALVSVSVLVEVAHEDVLGLFRRRGGSGGRPDVAGNEPGGCRRGICKRRRARGLVK
jgi:hypothetical protein